MSAPTARHETRALLRAHLAAASAYRHLTRHCAVCHRLLRLAMEPGGDGERGASGDPSGARRDAVRPGGGGEGSGSGGRDAERGRSGERAGAERPAAT
ncbi:DUF6274 family protein [Streptomyces sp. rh34]|uniref:DUF6274 family protein n=1 Tax=Streptomyces sp. rh34 TaxID=2034272 RepID=UPI000BEFC309|nr:DUF6274 family protein [Streptomyces sp. rh34]